MIYCLDTNVYIQPWNLYYPIDIAPQYRARLESLWADWTVFSPDEVKYEIANQDDTLHKRIKQHKHFFKPIDNTVQENLKKIMISHPKLVDSTKSRSWADPRIIAYAIAYNATVVTKELSWGPKKCKIPDVCQAYWVRCIDDFEFIKEQGFSFTQSTK